MRKRKQLQISDIEHILYKVSKPGRYIGGEINSVNKDINQCDVAIALCYPDVYEIGMSNLAIKILSDAVNSENGMIAERVFSPWTDMEIELRNSQIPYFSLESKTILSDFDIIGFSVGYELLFTNILCILELSNIPFYAKDRTNDHPLIIAGGPGIVNPEPIADFIDVIVIGEGETVIIEIMKIVREAKQKKLDRNGLLEDLTKIDGIYIPNRKHKQAVKRLRHNHLEGLVSPTKIPIPNIKPIQDRGVVEVSRGCTAGCRFCQAGIINRPVRERNVNSIVDIVGKLIEESGYYDISLMSLSIADYTNLLILLEKLFEKFKNKGVSFSLPSLRIDSFTFGIAKEIGEVKKFGITLAVESGNDSMRSIINKKYTEEKLLSFIEEASKFGWNTVKLYFMIGLPVESTIQKEEEAIVDLLNKISLKTSKRIQINAHIGIFIPKAYTPFQWVKMITIDKALEKIFYIKRNVKSRRVKIKYVNPNVSFLEGLLSLSGRYISKVIEKAYKDGARFDGWQEHFSLDRWIKACEECNINFNEILYTDKSQDYAFPWDNVDIKVNKDYLYNEYLKSKEGLLTDDCRIKCFENCGSCDSKIKRDFDTSDNQFSEDELQKILSKYSSKEEGNDSIKTLDYLSKESIGKIRIRFEKKGLAKFIGHLDLTYLIFKIIFLSKVPILFSKGFNPTPKMEFSPPLSVGIESNDEILEFKVYEKVDLEKLLENFNSYSFNGLRFKSAIFISNENTLSKRLRSFDYSITVTNRTDYDKITSGFEKLMENEWLTFDDKKKLNNVKDWYKEDENSTIYFNIEHTNVNHISLFDIIKFTLGKDRDELENIKIVREKINLIEG